MLQILNVFKLDSRVPLNRKFPIAFIICLIVDVGTETSSLKQSVMGGGLCVEKSTNERPGFDSVCIHRGIDPDARGTDSLLFSSRGLTVAGSKPSTPFAKCRHEFNATLSYIRIH